MDNPRMVAGYWHGGQTSALYAYCSSGTITIGLDTEARYCLKLIESMADISIGEIEALEEIIRLTEEWEIDNTCHTCGELVGACNYCPIDGTTCDEL